MGGAGSEPGAAGGTAAAAAAGGEELQPPPPELLMASHQQTRIQAYLEKNKIGPLFEVRRAPPGTLPCPALLRAVPPRPSAAPRSPAPPVPCGGGAGGAGAAPSPARRRGREGESRRAAAGRGARPRDSAVLQKTLWPAALREVLSAGVCLGTFLLLQVLLGVTERHPLGSGDAQMCIFYYFCA